jgi:hypothetical protein
MRDKIQMKTQIAEWFWRLLVLIALGWIGLQLQRLHEDIMTPVDEPSTVASADDDTQGTLDAIRDDIDGLTKKVDAIMIVMARAR